MANAQASALPESLSVAASRSRRSRAEPYFPPEQQQHELNERAVSVLRRVKSKLTGSDFPDQAPRLDVATQVSRLVVEAQSNLNLCELYVGWWADPARPPPACTAPNPTPILLEQVPVLVSSWC